LQKRQQIRSAIAICQLIVGTWKSYQQNTKVYDINRNVLLKDSTVSFTNANAGKASFEIYNADGSAYLTSLQPMRQGELAAATDTTSYLNYTILGADLTLKQTIGGSTTQPIVNLTSTHLTLENTYTRYAERRLGIKNKRYL
jgi:hypothetical protein